MKYLRSTIKTTLFFVITFGIYGVWYIGAFVIPNKQFWRQFIFESWAKAYVWLAGIKVEVVGDVPKAPFFLVANHLSYTDIPLLRSVLNCVFVAKGEIEGWFVAGKIVGDMDNIFIDRNNRRDIPRAGAEVLATMEKGDGVVVFPEGTSGRGEEVLPFNSSFFEFAARSELPVHFASITYRIDNGSETPSEYICWWDDTPFLAHMYRMFQLNGYTAIISFGEEPVSDPNRKAIASRLWERVNEKFIPMI